MKKRQKQALSLLEILFAIGFLTIILVAFAAVYPASYRLNRKSARATIAAKTASTLGAEILALPFDKDFMDASQPNLTELASDVDGTGAMKTFITQKMRSNIPKDYEVRPEAVRVGIYGQNQTGMDVEGRFARVRVTIYYNDSNVAGQEKSVTVISGKAENRDVR